MNFRYEVLDRLECVGLGETANQAIRHARKGSTIAVAGVVGDRPRIDLGLVQDRELRLVGTLIYQRHDYTDASRDRVMKVMLNLDPVD